MTSMIVALPKIEDGRKLENFLTRHGFCVAAVCTAGSQILDAAAGLKGGIVVCAYKMSDMFYNQLYERLPEGFGMLLLASRNRMIDSIDRRITCLAMPFQVYELVNMLEKMCREQENRISGRFGKARPGERNEQERKLIKEAKNVLMNRNHMTEEEAHRSIQKWSMDHGVRMAETARIVLAVSMESHIL